MKRPAVAQKLRDWYADPNNMALHLERMARASTRERISTGTKAALARPEVKAKHVAGLKRAFADPVLRQRVSVATKAGMERWRADGIAAATAVLRQIPRAARKKALAELVTAAGESR